MAELIAKNTNGKKRHSTRIDLTPMVDLGFLLITFFIFTTTLLKPSSMEVLMPNEGPTKKSTEIPHHCAMKIFIGENHQFYYLTGVDAMKNNVNALQKVTLTGSNSLRIALLNHLQNIKDAYLNHLAGSKADDKAFVLVKATPKSNYGDLIDLIDELSIVGINGYALMDIEQNEAPILAKL